MHNKNKTDNAWYKSAKNAQPKQAYRSAKQAGREQAFEDSAESKPAKPQKSRPAPSVDARPKQPRTRDSKPPHQAERLKGRGQAGGCPVAKKCGGCQLQNLAYAQQMALKQRTVQGLLGQYGKVLPIIGMQNPFHYRNKTQAAFIRTQDRRIMSGVYQSSTQTVVAVDDCHLQDKLSNRIVMTIRALAKDFKYEPYNSYRESGFLRHVLVKRAFATGQVMVVMVVASPIFPAKRNFVKALLQKHPEIETIIVNVNRDGENLTLGDRDQVLYGNGYIEDLLCGCRFRISARSFYQINPVQTEVLYQKAIALAGLDGSQTVLDAYCGTGTIGLIASKASKRVIGVENNDDAVRDAIANCKLNQIENAQFYHGDAGAFLDDLVAHDQSLDVVMMDPPRAGSDRVFLESLLRANPRTVVYISCNPTTLARDLKTLSKQYTVKTIQPVDLFPHTNHVETVCLLSRKNPKNYAPAK